MNSRSLAVALLVMLLTTVRVGADTPGNVHVRPTGPDSAVVITVAPNGFVTFEERVVSHVIEPLLETGSNEWAMWSSPHRRY
jgi:hypothetical protein